MKLLFDFGCQSYRRFEYSVSSAIVVKRATIAGMLLRYDISLFGCCEFFVHPLRTRLLLTKESYRKVAVSAVAPIEWPLKSMVCDDEFIVFKQWGTGVFR